MMKFNRAIFALAVLSLILFSSLFLSDLVYSDTTVVFGRPALGPGFLDTVGGSAAAMINLSQVYDPLFEYNDITNQVEPFLAESFDVNETYTEWTIYLREGVTFHDGTPLTAEAVKFSLDRQLGVREAFVIDWLVIGEKAQVDIIDELTLKITFPDPYPLLPIEFSYNHYGINSPTNIKNLATADDPWAYQYQIRTGSGVGAGPFQFVEFKPEEYLILERNENYWGGIEGIKITPHIDRLIMQVIPDVTTRRLMLERGDIDIAEKLPGHMLLELENVEGIKVESYPIQANVTLVLNTSKPPFDQVKVRQAIAYAINYDEIINEIEGGLVFPLHGYTPQGMLGHDPNRFSYHYNPEKARALLAEAGYPNGFETSLIWATARRAEFDDLAPALQSYLAEVGINVRLERVAFTAQVERTIALNHDISLMVNTYGTGDPDVLFNSILPPGHPRYREQWSFTWVNPPQIMIDLAEEGIRHYDPEIRRSIYSTIDNMAIHLVPAIPLYQVSESFAMREELTNFMFTQQRRGAFWRLEVDK